MDNELKHLKFKCPFTCKLSGPTGSGKTHLTRDIIKNYKQLFHNINTNDKLKVIWNFGVHQPLFNEPISSEILIRYNKGIPSTDEILKHKPNLMIFDDLMIELGNDPSFATLFTRGSHHYNVSVIFITQNLFYQGKQMRNIALNTHYRLIMKDPVNAKQIQIFASNVFPGKTKYFLEAYKDATKLPYSYIKVDLTQDTPDELRVRTNIIPIDGIFKPTIYYPKK